MVTIKSKKEIELMREVCKVVALVYEELEKSIRPGMTTWELDKIAEKKMRSLGAIPAEKGYDIVCSAVSSIVTTTVNNILSFHQSIEVKDENPVEIKVIEHDSITDTLLNNMIDLLKDLENQYQKNIRTEEKSEC